jgi:hypothetical protein
MTAASTTDTNATQPAAAIHLTYHITSKASKHSQWAAPALTPATLAGCTCISTCLLLYSINTCTQDRPCKPVPVWPHRQQHGHAGSAVLPHQAQYLPSMPSRNITALQQSTAHSASSPTALPLTAVAKPASAEQSCQVEGTACMLPMMGCAASCHCWMARQAAQLRRGPCPTYTEAQPELLLLLRKQRLGEVGAPANAHQCSHLPASCPCPHWHTPAHGTQHHTTTTRCTKHTHPPLH